MSSGSGLTCARWIRASHPANSMCYSVVVFYYLYHRFTMASECNYFGRYADARCAIWMRARRWTRDTWRAPPLAAVNGHRAHRPQPAGLLPWRTRTRPQREGPVGGRDLPAPPSPACRKKGRSGEGRLLPLDEERSGAAPSSKSLVGAQDAVITTLRSAEIGDQPGLCQ